MKKIPPLILWITMLILKKCMTLLQWRHSTAPVVHFYLSIRAFYFPTKISFFPEESLKSEKRSGKVVEFCLPTSNRFISCYHPEKWLLSVCFYNKRGGLVVYEGYSLQVWKTQRKAESGNQGMKGDVTRTRCPGVTPPSDVIRGDVSTVSRVRKYARTDHGWYNGSPRFRGPNKVHSFEAVWGSWCPFFNRVIVALYCCLPPRHGL
jgi:hypothetical protein